MKLENLRQDFPEMPDEIRVMVEQEVYRQINTNTTKRRKHFGKKYFVTAFAAAMLLGTTVFAGAVYKMRLKQEGTFAVHTFIEEGEEAGTMQTQFSKEQNIPEIKNIKMEVTYLPEGMTETETGKYSYTDNLYKGGVSIVFYKMDRGDAQFDMLTTGVAGSEEIKVGVHDGVYIELHDTGAAGGEIWFNQRIYVAFTDLHYVMELYAASDVSKEDAIKIAEGIRIEPVTDGSAQDIVNAYSWSDYLAARNETYDGEGSSMVPKSAMSRTHAVGETFMMADAEEEVAIKVAQIQVCDDISLLDLSVMDADSKEEIKKVTDASGALLPAKINYIRSGDGIHSVDEVTESREVPQKLVYATVEYTNTGSSEINSYLFWGSLVKIAENGNQMEMYRGNQSETSTTWDYAVVEGAAGFTEMWYYDVHGGERKNNYMNHLKAGETAVVHMAWIVPEEELKYLYLNLDSSGGTYEFDESALKTGYVDIRR